MKAIRIHIHGGPEGLQWEEVHLPAPGPGEVRIRHTAIGVNFSDINVRRGGFYIKAPRMPIILGNEAAGLVECVGHAVTGSSPTMQRPGWTSITDHTWTKVLGQKSRGVRLLPLNATIKIFRLPGPTRFHGRHARAPAQRGVTGTVAA